MKNKKSIAILMAAITLASCQSYKKVPYLQSYKSLTDKSYKEIVINEVNQQDTLYDAHIQPKDLLNITINTTDPQAAAPFNLTMQTYNNIAQSNASTTSQPALQQYLVDNAGEIDFPVIGRLKVGGLTKNAAENLIREQLRPYLKEIPIVTVRMSNYKISVLGEVNSPGTFTINNEKVNILSQLIIATTLFLSGTFAWGQEPSKRWSLEECIRYAIEHNIDLKQKEQDQESRRVELHTSKFSWLPDLNANVGQNFDFGRSPSKSGVIVDQNSANTSASVSLSMPIFDGLRIPNDIAARKLDLKAAVETLNKAKEDLSINVASYYLQVLYNKEVQKIAELQVALSNEQVVKTEALVKNGKVPLSQLYDMKAQLAKDEVSLTEARNNVKLALLDLTQSLELERDGENFDIVVPEIEDAVEQYMGSILPPDNVYDHAVAFKPQIKEQEFLLESQKKMLKVAQAGYYPKLNFGASYSNGYYHYSGDGEYTNLPFGDQLKNNGRKTIGFSLSIPLFNRFQVRNSVRSARINIRNRELMMENMKKVLYKEIQQAYYNATAAQEKYTASDKSVLASKEAFSYAEDRYAAGKSTVFEYSEAKTKYAQSLSEQAQAKYDFIFRTKILDFYNGTPITL